MKDIWIRIEKWLQENCPHLKEELNNGVSQHEIVELERTIQVSLPLDFLEFYKIHNGQNSSEGLFELNVLLPFDRIANDWNMYSDLFEWGEFQDEDGEILTASHVDKGIKNNWWNLKWIPIASDARGEHICLDFDPAEEGTIGQIIDTYSNVDGRFLLSDTFSDWIGKYVADLEAGQYVYVADLGVVRTNSVFAK